MNIIKVDQEMLVAIHSLLVGKNMALDKLMEFLALYLIYALPVMMILLWFLAEKKREALFLSFLGGVFSWLVITKSIVPYIWFRPRPDLSLLGVNELLFRRPDYSFPSDHATMLFALTFGFYLFGWRKAGNWFLVYSMIIVAARVAVGVHFPLDILAGAASGLIGVVIVKLIKKPILKHIYSPIVAVLKKIWLA